MALAGVLEHRRSTARHQPGPATVSSTANRHGAERTPQQLEPNAQLFQRPLRWISARPLRPDRARTRLYRGVTCGFPQARRALSARVPPKRPLHSGATTVTPPGAPTNPPRVSHPAMCHSQQYQWLIYRLKLIVRDQLLGRMLDLHNHPLNARELHWIVSIPNQ
jgi:hypothetical protein